MERIINLFCGIVWAEGNRKESLSWLSVSSWVLKKAPPTSKWEALPSVSDRRSACFYLKSTRNIWFYFQEMLCC